MRSIIIILLIFLFWSCTSCNENKPENDHDLTDIDAVTEQDTDLTDTAPDPDITDNDETPDKDTDIDNSVKCLDLKIQENVINTPFPFKDKDGKPTFCRSGCDTPTETDPQCVRNIWEWDNWEKYQEYINKETKTPECYPWPCEIKTMKADSTLESFNNKCDRWLTVEDYSANMGTIWSHGMSNGVAGMMLNRYAVEYNPDKDKYIKLGQSRYLAFNEERYVVEVFDRIPIEHDSYKFFVVSILRKGDAYHYELIYDSSNNKEACINPPFAGKKWVLLQLDRIESGAKTFKYAKAGEWEWQSIDGIQNYTGEGNIVGDHLTFITNNREMYYCDLTTSPKHINDCKLINRSSGIMGQFEEGHSPRIDTENEKRLVYNVHGKNIFVEVDFTDIDNPKYTEHEIPKNNETAWGWGPSKLKGNIAIYIESFMDGSSTDHFGCFYRFDKKKIYCPQENVFSTSSDNLMGYNTFWGKWHLWKIITSPAAIMRDWECYCEESGVCPFEE